MIKIYVLYKKKMLFWDCTVNNNVVHCFTVKDEKSACIVVLLVF